jgi:hypothetical protein
MYCITCDVLPQALRLVSAQLMFIYVVDTCEMLMLSTHWENACDADGCYSGST